MKLEEEKALKEIKTEFSNNTSVLSSQMGNFINTVAPYLIAPDCKEWRNEDSAKYLNSMTFFRLKSCTTENVDDLAAYLNQKIEKLFIAIHSINRPIVYGVVSREGEANIVIGVETQNDKTIIESMLKGLLLGVEVEPYLPNFSVRDGKSGHGGFISAIPVLKVDDEKQKFDLSTLMRSLNGYDYTVLFYATPISTEDVQDKYSAVLQIRDTCAAVSKRNISLQNNINKTRTTTQNTTRRGLVQEALKQAVRDRKFNGRALLDSIIDGGACSSSVSEVETLEALTTGVSFDMQNGMAIEMAEFCDKAIERLKFGQSIGLWGVTITYSATDKIASAILESCISGELAKPTTDILPMGKNPYELSNEQSVYLPKITQNNPLLAPITSAELGMLCTPPADAVPNFELKQGKVYPMIPSGQGVVVGKVSDGHRPLENMEFSLSEKDLNKHTFVCGITGSGKTTTVKGILRNCDKPFMVIESAKKEYRNIKLPSNRQKLTVYTLGKPEINCLQFNPFFVQRGINLQTHIDFLKDLFNASFSFYGPMPYILEKCLQNIYKKKGWNLTLGYHPYLVNLEDVTDTFDADYMKKQYAKASCGYVFPTMQDLKNEVKRYIEEEMQYDSEVGGNVKTAILARLESLCNGSKGFMFNTRKCIDMESLMSQNIVFELEGLADDSDKAFCVGLLVIFINEYRQVFKEEKRNEKLGLQHLLVIEEAHRLLKNVETERSSENMGNPKGKAVEHFTNMIAEMRSYGQGVIIAEQIPSKLAPDVIKNSSNKIIQRVVSADDQALVANTIGMKEEDAVYLGNLSTGVALCHKEGMSLPVYVNVNPVDDNYVSDSDLVGKDIFEIFESINRQQITENLSMTLETISLKLLNSIMALDGLAVSNVITKCREYIKAELIKRDVILLPLREENNLLGDVLADGVLLLLSNGVYGMNQLIPDDIYNSVRNLCKTGLEQYLAEVQNSMEGTYKRTSKNHCVIVISELLKHQYSSKVDVKQSIEQYFFEVPNDLVQTICTKVKGGV